jgi:bifunctional non-homologous end joining protein LigD
MKSHDKQILTHPDKIFWPKEKYTKGDVANYYRKIAPYILPYLKDRPQSLKRHPGGIAGQSFFQKDVGRMPPAWVKTHRVFSESTDEYVNYLICQDLDTLLYMVNLGCIEINPWNSRLKNLHKPDYMIFDLDPEKISFNAVVQTAQVIKKVLDELKFPSFPKTSGKTGLHIYVPMQAKYKHEHVKNFALKIVSEVNQRLPKITSVERNPKKRQGKVYLDYLQNNFSQTLAAPYSLRPVPGAPVATPLEWREVKRGLDPKKFNIKTIFPRLQKKGDIFRPVLGKGVELEKFRYLID